MPARKRSKVIIDTNIWISFLIGKELKNLKDLIVNDRIQLVTTRQLIDELKIVTSREKLKKYFSPDKILDLLALLDVIALNVEIGRLVRVCSDPKDDFCLPLRKQVKQTY